ncbi:MAG: RagB/SusD family nutrient uptake outer membrane protein [bacterium]|nr:RagB/SusD family nutrient uptake outer membrane protein [bacterium]
MKTLLKYNSILFALILLLSSCEDFLTEEPTTEITELDFFQDEANARLAVNAMYDPLGWGESTILGSGGHSYEFIIGDIVSDDSEKGSTDSDQMGISNLKNFTANGGTTNVNMLWSKHFIAIGRANLVIKNLEDSPIEQSIKDELEGEARFVRAYSYFTLVKIFGGVPLFESPVTPDQINAKEFSRAPSHEVYALIDEDFQFAVDHLPVKGVREVGRANQGAAAAYLARSFMYQIGTDNTNEHTWNEVLTITDDFISGNYGAYSLTPNYAEIFEFEGENNIESIFEIQAVDNGIDAFTQGAYIGSEWTVFQNPQFMGGWGFNTPTSDLASVFESNDPRRPSTTIAIGEFAHGVEMLTSERNTTGYYSRKAILAPDSWVTEKGSGYNIRKFRYADILLMNAEAAYHSGDVAKAVANLQEIRNRASQSTYPKGFNPSDPEGYESTGFAPLDNSVIPASGQALLDFIHLERRRELGMEQLRFWDLVRTGRFVNTMNANYGTGSEALSHSITSSNTESQDQQIINPIPVFPIPALEVANWGIEQNTNY